MNRNDSLPSINLNNRNAVRVSETHISRDHSEDFTSVKRKVKRSRNHDSRTIDQD